MRLNQVSRLAAGRVEWGEINVPEVQCLASASYTLSL